MRRLPVGFGQVGESDLTEPGAWRGRLPDLCTDCTVLSVRVLWFGLERNCLRPRLLGSTSTTRRQLANFLPRNFSLSHRLGQPTDEPSLRPAAVNKRPQPDRCRLRRGQALPISKSTIFHGTVQPRLGSVTLGPSGIGFPDKHKAASYQQIASNPTLRHIPDH